MVTSIKGNDTSTFGGNIDVTGNVVTNAPAFSIYPNSLQSITTLTWTKITFATEEFDTNNNYDNSTNYRFTPTVAGYYQISFAAYISDVGGIQNAIYKNGSAKHTGTIKVYGTTGGTGTMTSALIYMNGTTDYLEFYIWHNSGANKNVSASQREAWATGYLARAV